MFSEPGANAIKIKERVIYKQIVLCSQDASITKDVSILKENAGVTLAILDAVKAIKRNKNAFRRLAYHAGDLIVAIHRSYEKAKVPEIWLSSPLRNILRGLLENLKSMLAFVEERVSTNIFLLVMCNASDTKRINKYHQRLTIVFDKFEIQSHITTNRLLLQLLEKQKQLSNQMQRRNGVKNVASKYVADDNSTAKANKGVSQRTSIGVSTTLRAKRKAGSDRRKIMKSVEKSSARKAGKQSTNTMLSEDEDEPAWEEDEVLPSMTRLETRMHNFILPSTSLCHGPSRTDGRYATAAWTSPSCPSVTFSSSGKGMIINQGIGNVPYSNFLNVW